MGKVSTISSKGQITLPVEIRMRLGVKSGDQVEFMWRMGKQCCGRCGRRGIYLTSL